MLKYLILLLFLCSSIVHAETNSDIDAPFVQVNPTKPNGLPNMYYPDLRSPIQRRIDRLNSLSNKVDAMSAEIKEIRRRGSGTAEVTIRRNYPVVVYDSNHPNVLKEKEKTSKFTVPAKAKVLAGRFARRLNSVALTVALAEMVGEGIDWVLDVDNHQVVFKKPLDGYIFKGHLSEYESEDIDEVTEIECKMGSGRGKYDGDYPMRGDPSKDPFVYTACNNGWAHIWVEKTKDDTLSLDKIAQHVINNENKTTNNTTNNVTNNIYHGAVSDTISEQISKGEHDEAIREALKRLLDEETKDNEKDKDDAKTEEETDKKEEDEITSSFGGGFELPEFCDWASWFCEDETKPDKEPEVEVEKIDIEFSAIAEKAYISLPKTCPANPRINFTLPFVGSSQTLEFPLDKFCEAFALFKVIVIFMAYLKSLDIIGRGL